MKIVVIECFFFIVYLQVLYKGVYYYLILVDGSIDVSNKEKKFIYSFYVDLGIGKQRVRFFVF